MGMLEEIDDFVLEIEDLEIEQKAAKSNRDRLNKDIKKSNQRIKELSEELQRYSNAIALIEDISDNTVKKSYDFICANVNDALARVFGSNKRVIKVKKLLHNGQHPQLEVEIYTKSGRKRKLKATGRGVVQTISLMFTLSLIIITKTRRLLVLDEVLNGLSGEARAVICEILQAFTEIGFQFIIAEHGMEPKGAKIYCLEMGEDGVSYVKDSYVSEHGQYFGLTGEQVKDDGNMIYNHD